MGEQKGRESTRSAVLEAAAELFSREEYRAVTMDDLALKAGVAKGTLYNCFHSKEALFLTLASERADRLLTLLEHVVSEEGSAEQTLRKLTIHSFMFFVKYPGFYRLLEKSLAQGPCSRTAPIMDMRERLHRLFETAICRGMAEGVLRPVLPDITADVLFGAVMGTVPRCILHGVDSPVTLREREILFDLVWEAIRAREEQP